MLMVILVKTIYQVKYNYLIEALIAARKEKGLTQLQIANRLGKPQSYIAKIEGKDRKLDVMEFVELCEAIQQDPSHLIKHLQTTSHL